MGQRGTKIKVGTTVQVDAYRNASNDFNAAKVYSVAKYNPCCRIISPQLINLHEVQTLSQDSNDTSTDMEYDVDNEDSEQFVSFDLNIYPSDYTLKGLSEMWKEGEIDVPDFQRNFVWTLKQSSLLIESFLLGLPVPQVFFYVGADEKRLVIDGLQRVSSIAFFFEGFFGPESSQGRRQVFRLTGLDERCPYAKKRYVDLADSDQRKLRNTVMRVVNIKQLAPADNDTSVPSLTLPTCFP